LRREGRRKRKAGAKNEKAILIIALSLPRSRKNFTNIQKKFVKTPFFRIKKMGKTAYICKNDPDATTAFIRLHRPTVYYPFYVRL